MNVPCYVREVGRGGQWCGEILGFYVITTAALGIYLSSQGELVGSLAGSAEHYSVC